MLRHTSSWILSNSMTSLDNQFQCFNITVVKTFFLIRSFHVYNSLCPLLLIISLYITEKSQVLSSPLYLPLRSFLTALKSPLGHLFLKLSWSSSLSLTLCATWYSSPTTSFGFHNCSCSGEPKTGCDAPQSVSQMPNTGNYTLSHASKGCR